MPKWISNIIFLIATILVLIGLAISFLSEDNDNLNNVLVPISLILAFIGTFDRFFTKDSDKVTKQSSSALINIVWILGVGVVLIASFLIIRNSLTHAENLFAFNKHQQTDTVAAFNSDLTIYAVEKENFSKKESPTNVIREKEPATVQQPKNISQSTPEVRTSVLEVKPPEPISEPANLTPDNAYQEGRNALQKKNYEKAARYFQSAADRGVIAAAYEIALLYKEGNGVVKNESIAFKYMKMAAESNYHYAYRLLAEMYHGGRGVAKNNKEAENWYKKAAELGDKIAKERLYKM